MDGTHTGATPGGPFEQTIDPRVGRLDALSRELNPGDQTSRSQGRDPSRAAGLFSGRPGQPIPTLFGVVVHAIPGMDWYKVQTAEAGFIDCARLRDGQATPLGVRRGGVLPPGNLVLVQVPPWLSHGVITGVLPPPDYTGRFNVGDWIQQGGYTGLKRSLLHQFPITGLTREGGVHDFGAGRPMDETSMDEAMLSDLGVGWAVSPAAAFLRASEFAGLFVHYYDHHLSLRGLQMEQFSGAHLFEAGDDEGEPYTYSGVAIFPWEAQGRYDRGAGLGTQNSDADVQHNKPIGKIDLEADRRNVEPVHRYFEYGGYLGQGGYRAVMRPEKRSGIRDRNKADQPDYGLFLESIGREGAYSLQSAHSVHVGKRLIIAVPRRIRGVADPKGDDAKTANYKAAGTYGGGEEHIVDDPIYEGEHHHLLRAATVQEFITHLVNWKGPHPFHYHQADFYLPEEDESQSPFDRVSDPIDLSPCISGGPATVPPTRTLEIDDVRGEVDYFATESGLDLLPDGSVVLAGGQGCKIIAVGGKLIFDAPGGIHIRTGGTLELTAEQISMRAKRSIDISASEKDVRIKAEKHLHMLAGNSEQGSVLIESRGKGKIQDFEGRWGEDVTSAGVVIKATEGQCAITGKDVYVRSTETDVTVDAAQGLGNIRTVSKNFDVFATENISMYLGPHEKEAVVEATHRFGKTQSIIDSKLAIGGQITAARQSDLILKGNVYATGNVACGGNMATRSGGMVGKVEDSFVAELTRVLDAVEVTLDSYKTFGEQKYTNDVVSTYYRPHLIGDVDTYAMVEFSFRDDPAQRQYGSQKFIMIEPAWQTLIRHGAAVGISATWTETFVDAQGRETGPWPGKDQWEAETMIKPGSPITYDGATHNGKPRPYKEVTPEFTKVAPQGNLMTTR